MLTSEAVGELMLRQKVAKEAKKGPSRSPSRSVSRQREKRGTSSESVPEETVVGPGALAILNVAASTEPISGLPLGSPGRMKRAESQDSQG